MNMSLSCLIPPSPTTLLLPVLTGSATLNGIPAKSQIRIDSLCGVPRKKAMEWASWTENIPPFICSPRNQGVPTKVEEKKK